jgi:Ser/Thr protein kinase RdoA (MazF antagonist)
MPSSIDGLDREILTFHPGHAAWELGPAFPSDKEIARLGKIICDLHESLRGFRARKDSLWSDRGADPMGGQFVLHNDIGPWNLVVDSDVGTIIDWDEAAPG